MKTKTGDEVKFKTSIGGQALLEGIMMQGPKKRAIVVNTPDGFVIKEEEVKSLKEKYPVLGWPVIRGVVSFITSMIVGVRALTFSADCLPEEEQEEPSKLDKWIKEHFEAEKADKLLIGLSVFLGIILAIALFVVLPTFLTGFLSNVIKSSVLKNLIEGFVRIVIFLVYLWLATKMKDIQRVWQYHGAEHKTIFCYEKQLELTVENCRGQSRLHPRCGTSFLIIVMIISILVFSVVSWSNIWIRLLLRIVLLPVVLGLSYELIKLAGRYDNLFTRIISAPGKALQKLTTQEPDDAMLETAIQALKLVLPDDPDSALW